MVPSSGELAVQPGVGRCRYMGIRNERNAMRAAEGAGRKHRLSEACKLRTSVHFKPPKARDMAGGTMRPIATVCLLTGCLLLSGCGDQDFRHALDEPLSQASTAISSSHLALELDSAGKSTTAVTVTALKDMLKEAENAHTSVVKMRAQTEHDRALQDEALDVLAQVVTAVLDSEEKMESGVSGPELDHSLAELDQAAGRLSEFRESGKARQ